MNELSVLSFSDYRIFMKAVFDARKAAQPVLTLGNFSEFLGFGSANYFGLVISGKRNLTTEQIHKISVVLKLTYEETCYFEALVLNDQACSAAGNKFYTRRLQEIRRSKPKSTSKLPAKALLEEWYFPVFALLADGFDPKSAAARLSQTLPFNTEEINGMLATIEKIEILVLEHGSYRLNHRHQVFHDTQSRSARHKAYLRSQAKISARMLEQSYEKGARFYAHTFSVTKEDFLYYEDRLRALLSDFTARSDESPADEVVQLNAQLFRITKDCFETNR